MKTRCTFYVRTPIADDQPHAIEGLADYERISIKGPQGDGDLWTDHPPAVGDLIFLWSDQREEHEPGPGLCRVISRMWMHSAYGSANWPFGEPESRLGPSSTLIVELADGQFTDEAPRTEEDEQEQDG